MDEEGGNGNQGMLLVGACSPDTSLLFRHYPIHTQSNLTSQKVGL